MNFDEKMKSDTDNGRIRQQLRQQLTPCHTAGQPFMPAAKRSRHKQQNIWLSEGYALTPDSDEFGDDGVGDEEAGLRNAQAGAGRNRRA